MNFSIFVSDVHLSEYTPDKFKYLQQFFDKIARKADAIYILGDLFEIWVGDDDETPFNSQIKYLLKQFRNISQIPIFIVRGNHDFLLGEKFATETNCTFLSDPCLVDLYGRPTLVAHGDQFCTNNRGYLLLRKILYNYYWQKFFLFLPLKLRKILAKELRDRSLKKRTEHLRPCLTEHSIIDAIKKHNALQIMHGHSHYFECKQLEISGQKIRQIAVDSWDHNPNVLIYFSDHHIEQQKL